MTKKTRTLLDILDEFEPVVKDAFLASIEDIKSEISLAQIERLYRAGDVQGIMDALHLDPEFFGPFREALRSAYVQAGSELMAALPWGPGGKLVSRFNVRNPRAEAWINRWSSTRIDGILLETREAVRLTLAEGLRNGGTPRSVALDLVGRKDRALGRRVGGLIGQSDQGRDAARRAYRQLTSGNRKDLLAYKKRVLRDRRMDPLVDDALALNKPVAAGDARRMVALYEDRWLAHRGTTIARTELLSGLHAAQDEGLTQLISKGKLKARQVRRIWDAAEDSHTRESHTNAEELSRANPVGHGEPFNVGGHEMMYPGDFSLGAPAEEIINCRCRVIIDLDFISELGPND